MLERADLRALIQEELRSIVSAADSPHNQITVYEYATEWIARRRTLGVASVDDDETRIVQHVLPVLGELRLSTVRPVNLVGLIRRLESEGLAPRTILNIYGVLRVMFGDAVREELIVASPCILQRRRGELPRKMDRDPRWRQSAVFERIEVEALLADRRIAFRRRMIYAMELLAAMRVNEITPRRWFDYQQADPLWRLVIATGYDPKHHAEKPSPKSGWLREMPVHPTLKRFLDVWKRVGWREFYGRAPRPEDLILPSVSGGYLSSSSSWKRLQEDLDRLGFRHRRQHDSRRTFISLARADGAQKDLLHWCTHGPDGDIMDAYTQPPWPALCEQVGKLKIEADP